MDSSDLDELIDRLEGLVHLDHPEKGYWKEVWSLVKEIGGSFKETRYESKADKDLAWDRFQGLCREAKERSSSNQAEIEKRNRDWQERSDRSGSARRRIEVAAGSSVPASGLDKLLGEMIFLPLTLVRRVIDSLLDPSGNSQFDEARAELLQCNATMKRAWDIFKENSRDLLPDDRSKCFEILKEAQDRLNAAWAELKSSQDRFYAERRTAHAEKQREWERRQADFRSHVIANIEKIEGNIDKAENALERKKSHLDKLEDDYRNAWNDKFRDKCSDWIDEAKNRIADIEESIERMKRWLSEERGKL